ncbi:202_t:CDS:1, partial [Dentiscutata heterogama]
MVLLECGFRHIWAVLFLPFMLLDVRHIVGAFYSILGRVSCGYFGLRNFRCIGNCLLTFTTGLGHG